MQIELSGAADETLLRDAFRRIIERNLAFCLVVSDGISERIFYFAIGGIRVIASGPRIAPTLGEDLLDREAITPEQYNAVNDAIGGDARRFAEAVVQMGMCPAALVQETLVRQVEHELLDTFFWDGAELSLVEGQPPKSFYEGRFQTAALTCNVAALLQGVLERADVWRQTVVRLPSGREVFERTERADADLNGRHGRLLQLLDGTRTASDAIDRARMRRVPAFEFLMLAMQQGKVRRTVGNAAQRVTREQLLKDLAQLEQALRQRVDATVVQRRLARTLEQLNEASRAASQWRELGDAARKSNDLDLALQYYGECVRVLPTDFSTRELVLEIYRHKKEYQQVIAHGRPLADLFLKHNLLNRAKQLLLTLVGLEPTDTGLRRQLVLVLIGLGERDLALRHLRELARILEGRNASQAELREVYVRILALDPRDKAARKRLDEITGVATQRRVLRWTAAAAAAAVLGLGTLFWMEARARSAVNEAMADARLMLVTKDFAGARDRLQRVVSDYPVARATRSAQTFLNQIERLQREQAERAALRARLAGETGEPGDVVQRRERAEAAAAEMSKEASRLVAEGRLQDAHRVFKELLTMHFGTRAAGTVRIPLSLRILPRDARVILNGTPVANGGTVVEYCPAAPAVLEVERDGFVRQRITIDGLQPPELTVSLHRPIRWTASFDASLDAPPLVAGGRVFVAGRDRFLTALSAADGAVLWRTPLGLYSDAGAAPVASGGDVIVGTATGEAVCVDATTGVVRWRQDAGGAVERPLVVAADTVVATASDGTVSAIPAGGGEVRWKAPSGTVPSGWPSIFPDGTLGWIDGRGTVQQCDVATGKVAPRTPAPAVLRGTPVVAGEERVWAFSEDEQLRLVSASTSTVLRRFPVPRVMFDVAPVASGDRAYVVAQDGSVSAFTAAGDTVFRVRLEQPAPAGLDVTATRVYVAGASGRLSVLDAANGSELWRWEAGTRISARPLVADGLVFVATAGGTLTALETDGGK